MAERLLQWIAASVLAAGLSTAMLVGASSAAADPESDADTGGTATSQSEGPSGDADGTDEPRSTQRQAEQDDPESADLDDPPVDEGAEKDPDGEEPAEVPDNDGDTDGTTTKEEAGKEAADDADDAVATMAPAKDTTRESATDHAIDPDVDNVVTHTEEAAGREVVAPADKPAVPRELSAVTAVVVEEDPVTTESAPSTARVMMTAVEREEAAPPRQPTLLNIVGSLFFGVFDFVSALFEGPPAVPPGSTVRVGRSTLEIDCGDGYEARTDWYFPTEAEPDKIIYLQHGAFASAGLYNYTAAELAERNNATVVAPSITSNYFACDGCQMAGEHMHAAIADLFLGDRAALLASAQAAGFTGTALPQRFVIAGHSGGGQTAGGAAGYYAQFAPADRLHDMAGVLLLDSSPIGGAIERGVRKIPPNIPVYAISAEPGPLNDYGGVAEVLARVRPGFVGVQVIGGAHSDAWRTSNPLIQFVVGLGTGFSQPRNIEATHTLAQGWINDWFTPDDPDTGRYGERGEVITIGTTAGQARAYVIPGPAPQLTIIDQIIRAVLRSTAVLSQFSGNCAADPSAQLTVADLGQNSTPNTVLSLDEKGSRGQSVGQQCMDG